MIEQRQLLVDDMRAVGAAATEVEHRVPTSRGGERGLDPRYPAVVETRGTDALRGGVAQYDPDRWTIVGGRLQRWRFAFVRDGAGLVQ